MTKWFFHSGATGDVEATQIYEPADGPARMTDFKNTSPLSSGRPFKE